MSLVIDQSWVEGWQKGLPEESAAQVLLGWMYRQPNSWHGALKKFPPMCLVRAKVPVEVPFPTTVGYVALYYPDGRVGVCQEPGALPVPCDPETLEVAGYWKNLNQGIVEAALMRAQQLC